MFNPESLGVHPISFSLQIFVSEEYGFFFSFFFNEYSLRIQSTREKLGLNKIVMAINSAICDIIFTSLASNELHECFTESVHTN